MFVIWLALAIDIRKLRIQAERLRPILKANPKSIGIVCCQFRPSSPRSEERSGNLHSIQGGDFRDSALANNGSLDKFSQNKKLRAVVHFKFRKR